MIGLTAVLGVGGPVLGVGGRYLPILAAAAVAGSLAPRRVRPSGAGTLRTDSATFVIVRLTFVPALALGPLAGELRSTRDRAGR